FMAHGTADPILDISLAEMSLNILQQNHYQIEWHAYPMAHQVCAEELIAIGRWITNRYLSHPDT
ncbi:MAG TPA: carboxylesterase, partial [Coxiellaceae bacterium]|nr:carboxylesterase [Coxiellaceae bacterium]